MDQRGILDRVKNLHGPFDPINIGGFARSERQIMHLQPQTITRITLKCIIAGMRLRSAHIENGLEALVRQLFQTLGRGLVGPPHTTAHFVHVVKAFAEDSVVLPHQILVGALPVRGIGKIVTHGHASLFPRMYAQECVAATATGA